MAAKASRAVPHITMTPALELAIAGVKPISGVRNPANPLEVRAWMAGLANTFEDPTFFYADAADHETKAVETLIQVATLYLEHIRAGNLNDRKD